MGVGDMPIYSQTTIIDTIKNRQILTSFFLSALYVHMFASPSLPTFHICIIEVYRTHSCSTVHSYTSFSLTKGNNAVGTCITQSHDLHISGNGKDISE